MTMLFPRWCVLLAIPIACLAAGASSGCHGEEPPSDTANLPEGVRADYAVFAQRCSKCHSLSRPLNSGIVDDEYWAMYVARMRRQPESGISPDDARTILRFLHYYSAEQRRKKEEARQSGLAPHPAPAPPLPPPIDASAGDAR
jgi:hypothetical protein